MRTLLAIAILASLVAPGRAQAPTASTPSDETPTQFYLRYRDLVQKATKIEDVIALWSADQVAEFKAAPESNRVGLADVKRVYAEFTDVKVVKEMATPQYATLSLEGLTAEKKQAAGTAVLIKENGAWKVTGLESW